MKNTKLYLATLIFGALTFTSCDKDKDYIGSDASDDTDFQVAPTADDFNNLRDDALEDLTQTVQFNAEDGMSFTSEKGVQLEIFAGCLLLNGVAANGPVELEFVEIFDKGNMLTTNKATMANAPGAVKKPLETGGEFMISVRQNGVQLTLNCPMQAIIPGNLTGGVENDMTLWKGDVEDNGDVVWDEQDTGANGGVFGEGNEYIAFLDDFGWTNVDRFYNDPRPKTTLYVVAPDGYDKDNSAIYLSYDGEGDLLAQLDTFDPATNTFSEHYGQIPVGLEMHIIFVTEDAGAWRWAIQGVTVAANDIYTITYAETVTGTKAQMIAAIQALP